MTRKSFPPAVAREVRMAGLLTTLVGVALVTGSSARGQDWIWIEGEEPTRSDCQRHGWYDGVKKEVLSGGEWLSHYGDRPGEAAWRFEIEAGGEFEIWARVNDLLVEQRFRVDDEEWTTCDLDADPRERIQISERPDHRRIAWHRLARRRLDAGMHEIALRFESKISNHGGVDCLVISRGRFTPSGTRKPDARRLTPTGPTSWFPFEPPDDDFSERSIIDMTRLLHSPAGKHGFVRRDGADLRAGDRKLRLWGVGANLVGGRPAEWHERRVRYLAKHGINLVRQHTVSSHLGPLVRRDDGELGFDPRRLDEWDRWFALLKEHGIYMQWSVFYPLRVSPDDGYELFDDLPTDGRSRDRSSADLVALEPALQDLEWRYVRTLLSHRNPHTGLRYADDPALAIVEIHNEESLFWHSPLNDLASGKRFPKHGARLKARWAAWLQERYGTDRELLAAWGRAREPVTRSKTTRCRSTAPGRWPPRARAARRRHGAWATSSASSRRPSAASTSAANDACGSSASAA